MPLNQNLTHELNRRCHGHTRSNETNTQADIGGTVQADQLEDLMRMVRLAGGKVSLVAGVLRVSF